MVWFLCFTGEILQLCFKKKVLVNANNKYGRLKRQMIKHKQLTEMFFLGFYYHFKKSYRDYGNISGFLVLSYHHKFKVFTASFLGSRHTLLSTTALN